MLSPVSICVIFSMPLLSPVRELSFTCNDAAEIILPSAGTISPCSIITISPTVMSAASMIQTLPSRMTLAVGDDIDFSASSDFSALKCWIVPSTAFIVITQMITIALSRLLVKTDISADMISIMTRRSANCSANTCSTPFFFFSAISFLPYLHCLSVASSLVSPSLLVLSSDRTFSVSSL